MRRCALQAFLALLAVIIVVVQSFSIRPAAQLSRRHKSLGMSTSAEDGEDDNMCTAWTLEDDRHLFEAMERGVDPVEIATALRRGLSGVNARMRKIKDMKSTAYQRLFAAAPASHDEASSASSAKDGGLRPFNEVLGRILYDPSLTLSDFSFIYLDREEGEVQRCAADSNDSVKGKERMLIKALPEHRIQRLLYKGRVLWCKATRLDLVLGSAGGAKLDDTLATHDAWAAQQQTSQASAACAKVHLFCDLDGVLADFDAGCVRIHGKKPEEVSKRLLWPSIARQTTNGGFFDSLPWMERGQVLWAAIAPFGPTILTGTPTGGWAAPQKQRWCARELGPAVPVITCMSRDKYKFIVPPEAASETTKAAAVGEEEGEGGEAEGQRHPVASTSILIDDREIARAPWEAAGGVFVHYHPDRLSEVLAELQAFFPSLVVPELPVSVDESVFGV